MRFVLGISILLAGAASISSQTDNPNPFRVEIDLQMQTAYLIRGRRVVLESPISSGRYGHLTETGSFKILEKERNHYSSIYGKIVDASGNTIVADADIDMKVPRGGRFIPAPMHYFMRFNEADGMHAGYLPGYPASHGCVRMPDQLAIASSTPSKSARQLQFSVAPREHTNVSVRSRNAERGDGLDNRLIREWIRASSRSLSRVQTIRGGHDFSL